MTGMDTGEHVRNALRQVATELEGLLQSAREALAAFHEDATDTAALERCRDSVHQAGNVLVFVEAPGAARLAEEAGHLTGLLDQPRHADGEALTVLARALVGLSDYLDGLCAGEPDRPLKLLPLVNELRAARGAPAMMGGALLGRQLQPDDLPAPAPVGIPPTESAAEVAQRTRHEYQRGLLALLRRTNEAAGLAAMADVVDRLVPALRTPAAARLFWLVQGVLEALRSDGLAPSEPVRLLLGRVDQAIKRLATDGEDALTGGAVADLTRELMTCVGQATGGGERVADIQRHLGLERWLAEADDAFSGPARAALGAAAAAAREDLDRVREALEAQARSGDFESAELERQAETLARVRDTLGLLGLDDLRHAAAALVERLAAGAWSADGLGPEALSAVADGLLRLDTALADLAGGAAPAAVGSDQASVEWQRAYDALLETALQDLNVVRERLELDLAGTAERGDTRTDVATALARTGGVLRFGGLPRPGDVLLALSRWLSVSGEPLADERLAAAVVGVECHLAALRQDEPADDALHAAEQAVTELTQASSEASDPAPDFAAWGEPLADVAVGDVETPAEAAVQADPVDAEFVAVFLEEADEVLAEIQQAAPHWQSGDRDALVTVRRAFHTLKGSGRLVGANAVGELAWAVEDTLNRVLEERLPDGPTVQALVEDALVRLPVLLDALRTGGPAPDIEGFVVRAAAVREGRDPGPEPEAPAAPAAPASGPVAPELDVVEDAAAVESPRDAALRGVFQQEARTQLDTLRQALSGPVDRGRLTVLSRALHTLRGGGGAARAVQVEALSGALERYVRSLSGAPSAEGRALLNEGLTAIEAALAAFVDNAPPPDGAPLVQRIDEARARLQRGATADPELLATFLDEAADVLDVLDQGLRQWRVQPDEGGVAHLQRSLHTLKGSARLVGLQAIGDLSHAMETVLAADAGLRPPATLPDVLERCLDRLAAQCDGVAQGEPTPTADDLIEALEALARPVALPDADLEAAPRGFELKTVDEAPAEPEAVAPLEVDDVPVEVEPPEFDETPAPAAESGLADDATAPPEDAPEPSEPSAAASPADTRPDTVRVAAPALDALVELSGEVGIYRERLDQRVSSLRFYTEELDGAVGRLRQQLRQLDMETEARILFRDERDDDAEGGTADTTFDPLELDRYSRLQELARRILESLEDLDSVRGVSDALTREAETLLRQQGRVSQELQEGLLRTRMVPFNRYGARLRRLVRHTAEETGKAAALTLHGADAEVDRRVLERVMGPLEHLLRNAVFHGIERPEARQARGKPEAGTINLSVTRDGLSVEIVVVDDGAGLDLEAVRRKAEAQGLVAPGADLSQRELEGLLFRSGFSTAEDLSQVAGRGVGLDAVAEAVRRLGGAVQVESTPGQGATFRLRVPIALAVNRAMMVTVGGEQYALPLTHVETVVRVPERDLEGPDGLRYYRYGDRDYEVHELAVLLRRPASPTSGDVRGAYRPLVLGQAGNRRVALRVDAVLDSREVVVKPLGVQLGTVPGLAGATVLADGRIVFLLDVPALVECAEADAALPGEEAADERVITALVVDDSITMRRVTQRLLERNRMTVWTARDGVEALACLQDRRPDIVLMDIEMPRMDGYELCQRLRGEPRWADIPIVMITSRTGEKHQRQAQALGVDAYLGKPFQEGVLLHTVRTLTGAWDDGEDGDE